MSSRIGVMINAGSEWKSRDIGIAACEVEQAGFEAIFTAEIRTDALPIALFMGTQTKRIKVGTCVPISISVIPLYVLKPLRLLPKSRPGE